MPKKLKVAGTSSMDTETFVKHWNHRHREDLGMSPIVTAPPLRRAWYAFHRYVHTHNPTSHNHIDLETPDA